jgi:hypothetical protein
MNSAKTRLTLFLFWAALITTLLAGIAIRTYHLFRVGFDVPFNLGGLFYQASLEIIKNHYRLPFSIPYYFPGGLPFAYPPLPFYLQARLIQTFSITNYLTVNLLPPLFSIISLLSIPFLAAKVCQSKPGILFTTFAFAVMPVAFVEQIEAQGLAESFGTLALIWYAFFLLRVVENGRKRDVALAGVLLAVCVLGSPGGAYAAVLTSVLFAIWTAYRAFKQKTAHLLWQCLTVGAVGLALSSPYWLTVLSAHGIDLFLTPFAAQHGSLTERIAELAFGIVTLRIVWNAAVIWRVFLYYGLLEALLRKKFVLIFWLMLLYLIPREIWVMSVPAAVCIGFAVECLLERLQTAPFVQRSPQPHIWKAGLLVSLFLFTAILSYTHSTSALVELIQSNDQDISALQINDLKQMQALIPQNAPVCVAGNWGLIEWSPALLQREVLNNHYGLEWQPAAGKTARAFTDLLMSTPEAEEIMEFAQDNYNVTDELYIITSRAYLQQLKNNLPGSKTGVEPGVIKQYQDLTLGIIKKP